MPRGCYGRRKRIYTEEFSDEEEESEYDKLHAVTTIRPLRIDFGTTINQVYSRPSRQPKAQTPTNVLLESPKRTQRVIDVFSSSPTLYSRSKSEYTPPTSPIRSGEKQPKETEGARREGVETARTETKTETVEVTEKTKTKSGSLKEVSAWDDLFGTIEPKSPTTRQLADPISSLDPAPIDIEALVQSICVPVETKSATLEYPPKIKEAQKPSPIRSVPYKTYGDTRSFLADKVLDVATEHSQMISDTHDYELVETDSKADFDMRILGLLQRRRDDLKDFLEGLAVKRGKPVEAANQMLLECLVGISRNVKSHSVIPDVEIVARLQILCNKFASKKDPGSQLISKLISVSFFYMLKLSKARMLECLSATTRNDIIMAAKIPFQTEKLQVLKIALESLQQFICELPPQEVMVLSLVETLHHQPH